VDAEVCDKENIIPTVLATSAASPSFTLNPKVKSIDTPTVCVPLCSY